MRDTTSMLTFILRRLAAGALTVLTISVLGFFLLYLGARDTARRIVGDTADPEIVARKAQELGLDRPIIVQFLDWAGSALTGDLGRSWFSGQPVTEALASRLPVTLSLTIGAVLLTAIVGTVLGVVAATRRGWLDSSIQVGSFVGAAIPGFLVALVLVLVFAIDLQWVPATGYITPETSITGWLSTIILPIIALSIGGDRERRSAGARLDARRRAPGLRPHAAQPRDPGPPRGLRARAAQLGRPRAERSRHPVHRACSAAPSSSSRCSRSRAWGRPPCRPRSRATSPSSWASSSSPRSSSLLVNLAVDLLQGWLNPKVRLS